MDDPSFRLQWRAFKRVVKRIYKYKRQHLNILHIITFYNCLKQKHDFNLNIASYIFIFGDKPTSEYFIAKRIIKLIISVSAW
ncbi:glycogen/starch/alpha-glucan phosphorylase [cyanobacterium endosymbiont of Rhopalodia gibberula]|uniref:glycogen/starch/alpha-glucan phosphorylase n=1 Tax=cyanobacterium endosymbiont of Rhopalodia gibberula TaxID=1763363 RepID=UPI000E658427